MVTISRQAGTDGDAIARSLAEQLGWKLLDNEVLERLLVERGFGKPEATEFNERKPGFWHRFSAERDRYRHLLKMVIYEFARPGNCVILGRGGQFLFRDAPGVLRVRVVAPLQDRVARVLASYGGDEHRAQHALQHSDNDRAGFHRFLFHANWESSDLYDLIINTQRISAGTAVDLIRMELKSQQSPATAKAAESRREELYLCQKAIVTILFEKKLPIHFLEVEVQDGAVTLRGAARDHPSIERAADVASGIFPGSRIRNQIAFEPEYVERMSGQHPGSPK
jgi:cytidylate kinase